MIIMIYESKPAVIEQCLIENRELGGRPGMPLVG